MELESLKTLVLNDDFVPLNIVHWKKGIKRLFEGSCEYCGESGFHYINGVKKICHYCNGTGILPPANVVEYYDVSIRDSMNREHIIPAVISNVHHVQRTYRKVPYSRINVFRRDNYTCQYCGEQHLSAGLIVDHVIPRAMWNGSDTPTCWTNIVTCCLKCNARKANRTPEQADMVLQRKIGDRLVTYQRPKRPSYHEMQLNLRYRHIPKEWMIYLEPFMTK